MAETSQGRALKNYRRRLAERGLARFEVLGLQKDRALIRSLAKRLAQNDAAAAHLRSAMRQGVKSKQSTKGNILAALLRSPLVGADIDLTRDVVEPRKIDL